MPEQRPRHVSSLSDENPTQQCAPIGRGGDAHDVTEPQSFGNSSDCNLQRHDADNLNGSPDGSAAASESGVEGATSEATHASSPSSLQGQESEESTFEVTPFVMSFVSDHPAVEDVVNQCISSTTNPVKVGSATISS